MKKLLFPTSFILPLALVFSLIMIGNTVYAQEPVVTYTGLGAHTYTVPSNVTEIMVEAFGAGGRGWSTTTDGPGAGGGGGAYAVKTFTVTPSTIYYLYVGAGSTSGSAGKSSYFGITLGDSSIVLAKGGLSASAANEPGGGQSGSIGDITYNGGYGARGEFGGGFVAGYGGGGGSSAGNYHNGNYDPPTPYTYLQTGASVEAGDEGGSGGNGGDEGENGSAGTAPGGGGGGAYGIGYTGGSGANGLVRVSYTVLTDGTWTGDGGDGNWETADNWYGDAVPDGSTDVIFPSGSTASIASSGPTNPAVCNNLKIETGSTLTIDAGMCLTVNGTLTNIGTLNLNSDANGIASLMVDAFVGGGTNNIQLHLTGNAWHYVSSPVTSIPSTLFSNRTETAINGYFENLVTTNYNSGWVSSIGWHYNPVTEEWDWEPDLAWSSLVKGAGYNYYSTSTTSPPINITGTVNTAGMNIILDYNSGAQGPGSPDYPAYQGNNFLGNPFTCGMDWDVVYAGNSIWSLVESTIYFKRDDITYTYNPGTGETVPDDFGDGSEIPPMHGFFIKANTSTTLNIPASSKIHTGHARYKSKPIKPLIRLELENSGSTDQTLIAFNNNASQEFDNDFDGRKLFAPVDAPTISSSLNGIEYSINAVPYPDISESIPLVINAVNDGQYTITAKQIQGLDNYQVCLFDRDQDFSIDLSVNKTYSFTTPAGKFKDRFALVISDIIKAVPENIISDKPFNIYSTGDMINIQTLSDEWNGRLGEIKVFDMTGRIISNEARITFSEDEIRHLSVTTENGIYIVHINSGPLRHVSKVIIK